MKTMNEQHAGDVNGYAMLQVRTALKAGGNGNPPPIVGAPVDIIKYDHKNADDDDTQVYL
jgi:hypothetical protein